MLPFNKNVPLIVDGTPVSAGTVNPSIAALTNQTASIRDFIDLTALGAAIAVREAVLEPEAQVGFAVHLADDGVYRRGLAATAFDAGGVTTGVARSGFVAGIVYEKTGPTSGVVVIGGRVEISAADLAAASVTGVPATGPLYVSGISSLPGRLQVTKPPIGIHVAVCSGPTATGRYVLHVQPSPRQALEDHIHFKFNLVMMNSFNVNTAGWINVAQTSLFNSTFSGMNIPVGAVAGYIITADPALNAAWPPIPITGVYLDRNGTGVRLDGTAGQRIAVINESGIWWMASGQLPYGQAPINPGGGSPTFPDRLDFWLSRPSFMTSDLVVNSLEAANSSVTVTRTNGSVGKSGALRIQANIGADAVPASNGHIAIKYSGTGLIGPALLTGVVLEGIRVNGGGAQLSGGTPVNEPSGGPSGFIGGRVVLEIPSGAGLRAGPVEFVSLNSVDSSTESGVPVLRYRVGVAASIRGRIVVPPFTVQQSVRVEIWVLAKAAGTLPSLPFKYRIVSKPPNTTAPLTFPLTDITGTSISLALAGPLSVNQYVRAASQIVVANGGDVINFELSRNSSDGFGGDLSIIAMNWTSLDV